VSVAIVGAGIVGAATAWELARRGVAVTLLDAGEVAGGSTSAGEGNVLCGDKGGGPELDLAVPGLRAYDDVEALLGAEAGIRRKGSLVVHPEAATWAAEPARIGRLRAAGVPCEVLDAAAVAQAEPHLTGAVHGATRFPGDLQCAPRAIARGLAREAGVLGARVRAHVRVEAIAMSGGRVAGLETAGGRVGADAVVLAAGAWSAALAATAGLRLPVEPRWGQLVQLAAPEPLLAHKVVDGSYLASVLSAEAGLQVTTVLETTADGDLLVGSSRRRSGFDDAVEAEVGEAMVARAARLMPVVRELPARRAWSGLRPWLPDHLPAIGPSAAADGLWAATGHEGAGVALGPITGRLVAQALCGEPVDLPLAPFDPDRFERAGRLP
jgi:glycine/D-amino acid oxidase-like deaminating enzyme